MTGEDIIREAGGIKSRIPALGGRGSLAQVTEFVSKHSGTTSAFTRQLKDISPLMDDSYVIRVVSEILESFIVYVKNGMLETVSFRRQTQIDVVSDFLLQAQALLETASVHPAAPAVLIGASLEEFLRNWVEIEGINIGTKKPSLDTYAKVLREADLVTKQDIKDLTSWSGLRNHAAHGEWDEVNDKARIGMMLEGVNLFMRKYGAPIT